MVVVHFRKFYVWLYITVCNAMGWLRKWFNSYLYNIPQNTLLNKLSKAVTQSALYIY